MGNPLVELQRLGQSPWHDNIRRGLLTSGRLRKMVAAGDITGLTSNPTIFQQAVADSNDYDDGIRTLARKGKSAEEITDALTIEDIRGAADVFKPVYRKTKGADGYVSIEVTPALAHDTEATIAEAHRLWKTVQRPNLMVKIPATAEGVPAIEQCIADGLNINVTLIFSLQRYDEVMEAYLNGLERRVAAGKPVGGIASVASFFVSRVDSAVDKLLDERLGAAGPDQAAQLAPLKGKAAIANAKLAYAAFRRKFGSERFAGLEQHGGRVQRPLWASTSTKNPSYPDVYYVEALVGPDTVDTMPPATLVAYKDHGRPAPRLAEGLDDAAALLQRLEDAGISMQAVTAQLEREGVAAFAKSFESLIGVVRAWREALLLADLTMLDLGASARPVRAGVAALEKARFVERLWRKDPTLWKADDPAHQREIAARLGWLDVPALMQTKVAELAAFAAEIRGAGFRRAVLCGMGGSSLAPEILRATFGVAPGHLDVRVLDSTDPDAVRSAEAWSDPAHTLYIVSSKSGGTTEPNVFFQYFWDRVRRAKGERAGEHFVAITDPGTAMERRAREHGFRRVFLNPPEIGGRYSALSYFGLVPAALMGIDVGKLLASAERMRIAAGPDVSAAHNPAVHLGAALGALARAGRDKLTFVAADALATFGYWTEQLIAESTGKEGTGIVPIEGEPLAPPAAYGRDRVFVYVRLGGAHDRAVRALARAGHPVIALHLRDPHDLGGELLRWEIATAAAGFLLDIDPFDQPNVQESKDNTVRLLARYAAEGRLPDPGGALAATAPDFAGRLRRHLQGLRPGRYAALTAYVERTAERERFLGAIRHAIRDRFRVATTVGYGPRFLHSTGQLHKGGPATGVFVQLTAADPRDLAIPGERFTFGVLKAAQALGDYESLAARKRPILRVDLGADVEGGLAAVLAALAPAGRRVATGGQKATRAMKARGRGRAAARGARAGTGAAKAGRRKKASRAAATGTARGKTARAKRGRPRRAARATPRRTQLAAASRAKARPGAKKAATRRTAGGRGPAPTQRPVRRAAR